MFIVRKFLVRKHERALLYKNGDFVRFLEPGEHYVLDPLKRVTVEVFNVAAPLFEHRLADFFVNGAMWHAAGLDGATKLANGGNLGSDHTRFYMGSWVARWLGSWVAG